MAKKDHHPRRPLPASLKTIPLDSGDALREQVAEALRSQQRPSLVVLHGAEVGRRCVLDGSSARIGRDPDGDVVLTEVGISWAHARIEDRGDGWTVVDLGSTNGTFVHGERVQDAPLRANDKITFGSTVVRFEVEDALEHAYGEQLQRLLNIDDLSGLYVRRRFDAELQVMLNAARSGGASVGLLVMDLDGIKQINDTHGHLFGAYVIGEAGHLLGRLLEGRGMGTRFGGDEFIAAVPGYALEQTAALGEEIRQAVQHHHFERDGVQLRPGISIGAAAFPESATDATALFQRADEALYRAKASGKNRVCR